MSITVMCGEKDAGAVPVEGHSNLFVHTKYVGKVVSMREKNGYDDSDFYATAWDDEKQSFVEIEYATTRGWSYCNSADIDASPELIAQWEREKRKREEACARINREFAELRRYGKPLAEVKTEMALPEEQWTRLVSLGAGTRVFDGCLKLLRAKLRSPFRKSLREQLQKWIRGESTYPTPFSSRQAEYL